MTASSALSLPAALPDAPDAGRVRARAGQGADFALLDEADEWAAFSHPVAAAAGPGQRGQAGQNKQNMVFHGCFLSSWEIRLDPLPG